MKNFCCSLLLWAVALIVLFCSPTAHADLVGLWRFDDSGLVGKDSSDRSNHLTASGDAAFDSTAKFGAGALLLDGDGDMLVHNTFPTDVPIGNNAYTIAAWINVLDLASGGIAGWGQYGTTNQANGLRTHRSNPETIINFWWGNDHGGDTGHDLRNTWTHIAAVYDPTAIGNDHFIYINGTNPISRNSNNFLNTQALNFAIGRTTPGFAEFFNGRLDDVAIFNQALTQPQIAEIMGGDFSSFGVVPEPSGLLVLVFGCALIGGRRNRC